MSYRRLFFIVAVLTSLHASSALGSTWSKETNMNVLPHNDGWIGPGGSPGGTGTASIESGILHLASPKGQSIVWRQDFAGFTPVLTYEIRFRIVSGAAGNGCQLVYFRYGGSNNHSLAINARPDGLRNHWVSEGFFSGSDVIINQDLTDDFHTLWVAFYSNFTADVWLDCEFVTTLTNGFRTSTDSLSQLHFGAGFQSESEFFIDYVRYSTEGALSPSCISGLFIGSNAPNIAGQADADGMLNGFKRFATFRSGNTIMFDYQQSVPDARQQIFDNLKAIEVGLRSGDIFVLAYSGHGGYLNGIGDEVLAYTANSAQYLSDDILSGWFEGSQGLGGAYLSSIWQSVNKLVILDCCHSGGFWGPGDDEDDLKRLNHIGLLATALETDSSTVYPGSGGRGPLALAVEFGLQGEADTNSDGEITWNEITSYLQNYTAFSSQIGFNAELKDEGIGAFAWAPKFYASEDFELNLLATPLELPAGISGDTWHFYN